MRNGQHRTSNIERPTSNGFRFGRLLDVGCFQAGGNKAPHPGPLPVGRGEGESARAVAATLALIIFACAVRSAEVNSVVGTNLATTNVPASNPPAPLETPRDFFNAGTRKLQEKKWQEAETCLQTALSKQKQSIQPATLYNLGEVRFLQGMDELKKSLQAGPTAAAGRAAAQHATSAIDQANEALVSGEIPKMVDAYIRGRGTRKEIKAAQFAVKRALELHGVVLRRWQRSLSDFKSALELNPSDTNAQHNVQVVEKAIAKLVDMIEQLQQAANAMAKPEKELGEKMKKLRGQIPEPDAPPGAAGDEDEDEEEDGKPKDPKEGEREGPNKEGREIFLTPEEAGWLLERFRLGGDKRLPMGQGDQAPPKDRKGRNW